MAITIETSPSEPLISGNPAFVEVSTDKRILTTGTNAEILFSYATQLMDGAYGELQWNGESYLFEVSNAPDDSGFQLPEFNDAPSFALFIAALENNYYINKDFTVVVVNPAGPFEYKLVARETGKDYEVIVIASNNWTTGTLTPATDQIIAENFRGVGQLYADSGNGFELVNNLDAGWDNDDKAKIYIDRVLNELFELSLPPVDFPGVGVGRWTREMPEMLIEYYVELREFYGIPPRYKSPTDWGTLVAPKRAADITLSKDEFPGNTVSNDYFDHADGINLITDSKSKLVLAGQTDYYFVHLTNGNIGNQAISKVDLYYKDGTTDLNQDISNYQFTVARDAGFIEFAMDWGRIKTLGLWAKPVEYAEVYLRATYPATGILTEKVRVYFDDRVHEYEHYFVFKNRFGGWSTIGFTGKLKKNMSSSRSEGAIGSYDGNEFGDVYTYNHNYQYSYECGTGLWPIQFVNQIVEFSNSERVYYLDGNWGDSAAQLRHVIIQPDGFSELEDAQRHTFQGTFNFRNAQTEL